MIMSRSAVHRSAGTCCNSRRRRRSLSRKRSLTVLAARAIPVAAGPVEAIEAGLAGLTGVRLAGGGQLGLDVVVVAPRMHARAELLAPLGLEPAELRHGDYLIGT